MLSLSTDETFQSNGNIEYPDHASLYFKTFSLGSQPIRLPSFDNRMSLNIGDAGVASREATWSPEALLPQPITMYSPLTERDWQFSPESSRINF